MSLNRRGLNFGWEEMTEDGDKSHQKILGKQMLAGGTAGMLADMVMYPMMTVKSRLMVRALNYTKPRFLTFFIGLTTHSSHRSCTFLL